MDKDMRDSHLALGEEEAEPMEEDSRTEQVNYLVSLWVLLPLVNAVNEGQRAQLIINFSQSPKKCDANYYFLPPKRGVLSIMDCPNMHVPGLWCTMYM